MNLVMFKTQQLIFLTAKHLRGEKNLLCPGSHPAHSPPLDLGLMAGIAEAPHPRPRFRGIWDQG